MSEREKVKRYAPNICRPGASYGGMVKVENGAWVRSEDHDSLLREVEELEKNRDSLKAKLEELETEVHEWICGKCHRVYPGIPRPGERNLLSAMCLDCDFVTIPKGIWERQKLTADRDRLQRENERLRHRLKGETFPSECAECAQLRAWRLDIKSVAPESMVMWADAKQGMLSPEPAEDGDPDA